VLEEEFRQRYDLARIGVAAGVEAEFYAICVERKIQHAAVAAITGNARGISAAAETERQPVAACSCDCDLA
jgi:hypothetical protein